MTPSSITATTTVPVPGPVSLDKSTLVDMGDEAGQATVEWLGIAALSIVAIIAIFAALQALGLDVIDSVRTQLGL
jgi:hypothetical protein